MHNKWTKEIESVKDRTRERIRSSRERLNNLIISLAKLKNF